MASLQNKLNKLSQSIKLHEQELNNAKKKEAAAKALAPAAAPDGIAQLCRSLWPEIFR